MLGAELSLAFDRQGIAYIGTDREVDITDQAALSAFAQGKGFTWIINCAAYTAVDKAEDDTALCRVLNVDGPGAIAETARNNGARLVHISTDYVFNGRGIAGSRGIRAYREDDPTDPIGVYGLTKRDGETAVFAHNNNSYIIRTAWLYGKYGNNFVRTMLRLMRERESVSVVNDQRGTPTWAYNLAETIIALIEQADSGKTIPCGIYHYSGGGPADSGITWFDFASAIYEQGRELGLLAKPCAVKPCASAEFPAKVKRPAYSVLDKSKIKAALGIIIPDWKKSLEEFLKLCEV
jgi:dTDP-4-dehydrorhamnose reductase